MRGVDLVLAALLGAALCGCAAGAGTGGRTATVKKAPLATRTRAQGTLESVDALIISPPVIAGQWDYTIQFLAQEGKEIKAGAPVVAFDTRKLAENLEVLNSELATAQKELEKTTLEEQEKMDQLQLDRTDREVRTGKANRKLAVPENLLSRNELSKARLELDAASKESTIGTEQLATQKSALSERIAAAQAKVARLQERVNTVQDSIRRSTVMAPRAGFVVLKPDWEGKKVVVGNNVWFGQPLLEIADVTRMRVAAVIPEPEAGKIASGQRAEIRLDANPDRLFHGRVGTVGRIFRTKSWETPSIVCDAEVSIEDPDPALMRPGMAADVTLLGESAAPVLQLPERAVRFGKDGAQVDVRGADGTVRAVPVTLGRRSGDDVEVLAGVKEGDTVVLGDAS